MTIPPKEKYHPETKARPGHLRLLIILGTAVQYSSGNSRVVADRSASVIIQIFSPAPVS
jgi:hypothetical protein